MPGGCGPKPVRFFGNRVTSPRMTATRNDDLFPDARNPEGTHVINDRCLVKIQDGHCVVIVSGVVLAQYAVSDHMAEAHAMVSLVEQGWADQIDVARTFSCSVRTVRRHQRRFEEGGLAALGQTDGYPRGRASQLPSPLCRAVRGTALLRLTSTLRARCSHSRRKARALSNPHGVPTPLSAFPLHP